VQQWRPSTVPPPIKKPDLVLYNWVFKSSSRRVTWHREDTRQDRKGRRWAREFERVCAGVWPNYKAIQAVMGKQMLKIYFGLKGLKGQLSCLDICSVWLLRSYIYIYLPQHLYWRGQWHPTPVLLPGKSHGWRSLEGCSPWGCWGSDTTERLHFHFSLSCIGEGNGNPLQCSCLENPRDGEARWAAVCGVRQSRTRLKWLSN